uniref:Uncharacterized protein n=1 Tax=viral metagenome TaxID=1070528 RepID=A0A6M3XV39_9ZZZZ
MHIRYHCRWFKFDIMSFDFGWQIGIRFNNWACRIPTPIPLEKGTILYSIRQQGLFQSLRQRFHVPPKNKVELSDHQSDIAKVTG